MKILQIVPAMAPGFGGPSNAVLKLSEAIAKQGEEVSIFTTDADVRGRLSVPLETAVHINKVKLYYFPVQGLGRYKFSFPLLKALKKEIPHFDIVHIHSLFQFSTLAGSFFCQKYRKPYLVRPLGQLDPVLFKRNFLYKKVYFELFERRNLKLACALHFTSEMEKDWCKHLNLNIPGIVVPLGIDLEDFKNLPAPGAFRSQHPELKNKKVILFLGRINFKKGLDLLTQAFIFLAKERQDAHLVIVGPDDEGYATKIRKWLSKEKMLRRATFTGILTGENKLAAFRDSDVFVLPSYSENFGIAVVEAMACQTPIVISNKIGIHREIERENAGIITECRATDIYRGIKSVLDNQGLAQTLSANAKRLAQEYYDIDKVAQKLTEFYRQAAFDKRG